MLCQVLTYKLVVSALQYSRFQTCDLKIFDLLIIHFRLTHSFTFWIENLNTMARVDIRQEGTVTVARNSLARDSLALAGNCLTWNLNVIVAWGGPALRPQ